MKANYRRWFLWSSFGGLAVGAVVAMTRRTRRLARGPLSCRKLPGECREIVLWTERFEAEDMESRSFMHDRYVLQPTPFRVWSILDLPAAEESRKPEAEGSAVFHVTRTRIKDEADGNATQPAPPQPERFYGLVGILDPSGRVSTGNSIARGGILEIRKCYVGGASNGVESGEIHHSAAPILNYRIFYDAV